MIEKRKITVTGVNIIFLVILALCLVFSIVLGFLEAVRPGVADRYFYETSLVIQYGIILIPVVAYVLIKRINPWQVFRFNRLGVLPAVIIALLSVPAMLVASMLNTFVLFGLQRLGEVPPNPIPVPHNLRELIIGLLVVAVSPAICEEILNRGLVLRAYENRGSLKAVVISAIFFGFFHFDLTNLLGPIFLGLLIGYYVIRTNTILAGMLAHFLNNALSELYNYLWSDELIPDDRIVISLEELISTVLWGGLALVIVWVLLRLFRYLTEGGYRMVPAVSTVGKDIISIVSHWPIILVMLMYLFVSGLYLFGLLLT